MVQSQVEENETDGKLSQHFDIEKPCLVSFFKIFAYSISISTRRHFMHDLVYTLSIPIILTKMPQLHTSRKIVRVCILLIVEHRQSFSIIFHVPLQPRTVLFLLKGTHSFRTISCNNPISGYGLVTFCRYLQLTSNKVNEYRALFGLFSELWFQNIFAAFKNLLI